MTKVVVSVDSADLIKDLVRLGVDVKTAIKTALLVGEKIIERAANEKAPGRHITHDEVKQRGYSAEVDIGPDDDHWYYRFFETGAAPHPIQGNPLRFIVGGDPIFARFVSHPGMGAKPFLRPALDENTDKVVNEMGDQLKKVIK